VFLALLKPGDTFLGMDLSQGGHLTHGSPVNFSGKLYNAVSYGVRPEDHLLDYDQMRALAREHRPKMIIAGSAPTRAQIDFARVPRDRRRGGRDLHGGHGALRRARRRRACTRRRCRTPTW
jgi:glycine hydroxymethyltransferase